MILYPHIIITIIMLCRLSDVVNLKYNGIYLGVTTSPVSGTLRHQNTCMFDIQALIAMDIIEKHVCQGNVQVTCLSHLSCQPQCA